MDTWTLTGVIITSVFGFLSVFLYFRHRKLVNYFSSLGIPHPRPLPIIGNMWPLIIQKEHFSTFVKNHYNYDTSAKYIGLYDMFLTPLFLLRDPEVIKTIVVKNFDNWTDRSVFVDRNTDPFFGKNLSVLKGQHWRDVRNLLSPAFTSSKMKMMFILMKKCAETFTAHMTERINTDLEVKDIFSRYTNDVIATCGFGVDIDSIKEPKNDFYVLGKEATRLEAHTMKLIFIGTFPAVSRLLGMKLMPARVAKFFTNLVKDIIIIRDAQGIARPDMLQLMMDARGDSNNKIELTTDEMTYQAFIFFFGGFETTSSLMCFVAHELALHPEIQEKLQDEVDQILKNNSGEPNYEAISDMPYLEAVINETMRLHPQAAFIDRVCTRSFELPPALPGLKPVTVQPGAIIWIPIEGIHTDPKYYENPDKFIPERFLEKMVTPSQTTFLGFGIGPRMCIGNRFALLEIKILFFHLLAKFSFKACAKTSIPLELNPKAFTITVKGGFWLQIVPRTGAN